jgi:catechol 2,3-dioxygenase-like lactoylglutathione lyase family enzyme
VTVTGPVTGPGTGLPVPADQFVRLSFCLSVADLDRSAAWYRDVLGFRPRPPVSFPGLRSRLAFTDAGGFRFEMVETQESTGIWRPEPPRHTAVRGLTQLALYVHRLEPVLARLAAAGVRPTGPVTTVEELGIRACFLRDPDANLIELIEELDNKEITDDHEY